MADDDDDDGGPNPPFVIGWGERADPEAEKAALWSYFKAAGTPEAFYGVYPDERPPEPEPGPSPSPSRAAQAAFADISERIADNARSDAAPAVPHAGLER